MKPSLWSSVAIFVHNTRYIFLTDMIQCFFSRPGQSQGCSTNTSFTHSLIDSFIHPLVPTALLCRHAQTVGASSSSYKIDYFIVIKHSLNLKGHQNPISASKVTTIILKRWILPISGASAGKGLRL